MLLLVIFLVTYISIKFREKKDDTSEPRQTHGNKKLEALMIGVPMLLLAYFFYETIHVEKQIAPSVKHFATAPRLLSPGINGGGKLNILHRA